MINKKMINYKNLTNNERETIENLFSTLDILNKYYKKKEINKSTYIMKVNYYEDFLMAYLGDNYLENK